MKRISVDIDEQSHRALKTAAAERGVTIAEVVRQLVQHWTHTPERRPDSSQANSASTCISISISISS